jgi:hypothetical protein
MEAQELLPDALNDQQILMLRLLKIPMAESDFIQIRRLAVKLLSKQMDEVIKKWNLQITLPPIPTMN